MINKIVFNVETITPMFLAGADQRKAELRAASIKGLLRFWWRALQAESDIDTLRKRESEIFGSADEKAGSAKFSIRVTQPDKNYKPGFKNPGSHDPVGYMLYSAFVQKDRMRPYYPEGSKFSIILSSRDEQCLKIAAASLWVLIYCGALGMRSRRGAGNIVINSIEDPDQIISNMSLKYVPEGNSADAVSRWLIANMQEARGIVNDAPARFVTEYSNLAFSRFVMGSSRYASWKEALTSVASSFKQFREAHKGRILDTASFGFPVMHSNRTTVKGHFGGKNVERRGSPLIFKLIKAEGRFYWMVIRLSGEMMPEGGTITAVKNKEAIKKQKADFGIIDEFWATLKNEGKEYVLLMPDNLRHIAGQIKRECNAGPVILFGSRARGDAHSHSDIDIAIDSATDSPGLSVEGMVDIVSLGTADDSLKKKIEKEGVRIL